MEKTNAIEVTGYSKAMRLHGEIMANAEVAAASLTEMCRALKQMRDEALYKELDFDSFDAYCEQMAGISSRQAYTYISTFERLGEKTLQSTARLGITKLDLLARLSPGDRAELLEDGSVDGMSVSEIRELVKAKNGLEEQNTLLEAQLSELRNQIEEAADEYDEDEDRIDELADVMRERDELERELAELRAARAAEEAEQKLQSKINELAEKEASKRLAAAKKEAAKEAAEKAAVERDKLKAELTARVLENERLQRQLKTADPAGAKAVVLFDEFRDAYDKLCTIIEQMPEEEQRTKFRGAVKKALEMFIESLG